MKKCQWALPLMALPLQAQTEQPNIILINIDDMGWSDMSNNGSSFYETPNIDQLRTEGIWFQQAYAGAANSAPSRACMLTGMNTPRHGMFTVESSARGNKSYRKFIPITNKVNLDSGIQMLPQVLRQAGYHTAHIGKWHVTGDPLSCGMEVNIAGGHEGHPYTYYSPYHLPQLTDGPAGEHLNERLGREAANYIQTVDKSKPFFLYLATYAIHAPLEPPVDLVPKYESKTPSEAHYNPKYAALLESMDQSVGQVMAKVKEMGLEDRTLIIFTSDNGGVYNFSRQWPLRAGKGSFYEGGIRVPMVFYQKGKFEKGEINDVPVSQLDLFPTLLDLAHISTEGLLLDGKSLVPTLENKSKELAKRPLFWNFPGYLEGGNAESHDSRWRSTPQAVIRKGDWKLIKFYEDDSTELYNMKDDISEQHNLAQLQPEKAAAMLSELEQWQKDTKAPIVSELNPDYIDAPAARREGIMLNVKVANNTVTVEDCDAEGNDIKDFSATLTPGTGDLHTAWLKNGLVVHGTNLDGVTCKSTNGKAMPVEFTFHISKADKPISLKNIGLKIHSVTNKLGYHHDGVIANLEFAAGTDETSLQTIYTAPKTAVSGQNGIFLSYTLPEVWKADGPNLVVRVRVTKEQQNMFIGISELNLVTVNEETGIETVVKCDIPSDFYDLCGRKVAHPTQGFYVKDGKKYFYK